MALASLTTVQESYLKWAENLYRKQKEEYEKYDEYYEGEHELEFATDTWKTQFGTTFEQFSDNWCQVVVDSMVQRLKIIGWTSDDKKKDQEFLDAAEEIWDDSEVDLQEEAVHLQAAVKGDSFLMVWPNPDEDEMVDMIFHDALDMKVFYDPSNLRKIVRAAKRWIQEDGNVRMNIYLPEETQKYVIERNVDIPMAIEEALEEVPDPLIHGWTHLDTVPNKWGVVPVFHFRNKPRGSTHGLSELKVVIPIQNSVNKTLMDMMVTSEFQGFQRTWVAGGGHPRDGFKVGANRLLATTDSATKFGVLEQADLEPFTRVVEMLVGHIAKLTSTPMHYLRTSGDMPSGEALKTAESGLVHKCNRAIKHWKHVWGHAMRLGVAMKLKKALEDVPHLHPVYDDPETRHDLEQAQTAQLKSILGVPIEQLWSEHFGYSQEQIEEFKKLNKAVAASALIQLLAQPGQLPPGMSEQVGTADMGNVQQLMAAMAKGDIATVAKLLNGMDPAMVAALFSKSETAQTTAGEATTKPQANTRPPASPTRRSSGFKD